MRSSLLVGTLLDRIKAHQKTILVIGDTMTDQWVSGNVTTCQDGCPKFVQNSAPVETPGGAANARRSICMWPVKTDLYGFAENDRPVKTRYVEADRLVFRADDDKAGSQDYRFYNQVRDMALEAIPRAGGVLLSDYDKGFLPSPYIKKVAQLCKKHGIPCVADCKRAPEVYEGCILKGNLSWLHSHCKDGKPTHSGLAVITRGDSGHIVGVNGDVSNVKSGNPVKCVNHVGAGDCFAAHLTLALAYGFSLKDAATLAHSAGRVYVQHPYNRPPLPDEIRLDLLSAE